MAAPANDNFASAQLITGSAGSVVSEVIDDATTEVGEPFSPTMGPSPGFQTIWYRWVAPATGDLTVQVSLGEDEPVIAVWSGATLGTLVEVGAMDDPFSEPTVLTVPVVGGTTYHIQIGTWNTFFETSWLISWFAETATPEGVGIAFNTDTLGTAQAWVRLDDSPDWNVTGYTIQRGRQTELDKTGTGSATIEIADKTGAFDPTNTTSPFYGLLDPFKQAKIVVQNPVTSDLRTLFTGFVSEWPVEMYKTGDMSTVNLELVDGFAILNGLEMLPAGTALFGTAPPTGSEGDIYFAPTSGSAQVRGRINQALTQAGWPLSWRHVFSGNVDLQGNIYARRESLLTVLLDAADAEFPGVSNVLISRIGTLVFRGRYARFNPEGYVSTDDDDLRTGPAGTGGRLWFWRAGGRQQTNAGGTVALVSDVAWSRSETDIINAALALPKDVEESDVPAQLYKDDASIATYGWRAGPDMENLLVEEGNTPPGQTAVEETRFYAEYYVENYKTPHTRIPSLPFQSLPLTDPAAPATWAIICGAEIGDVVTFESTHFGGQSGFGTADWFIEGIRYESRPAAAGVPYIRMELDMSPRGVWAHNPWGTTVDDTDDVPAE